MKRELQGQYIATSTAGEKVRAFVPTLLPPIPAIEWTTHEHHLHTNRQKVDMNRETCTRKSIFLCMTPATYQQNGNSLGMRAADRVSSIQASPDIKTNKSN